MKQQFHIYIESKETWLSAELVSKINTYLQVATDTVFELSICGVKSKRSSAQNRFYYGVVLPALVEAGKADTRFEKWQDTHWHACMKEAFLRGKDEVTGRIVTRSTTELTVEEMTKYMDTIIDTVLIKTLNGCIMEKHKELYQESKGV